MEIISGLINNNQKVQSAEEVIPTLCDRLRFSKLASDRRAAILSLKGFSREYRESVVANGLRGLISTLIEFSLDTEILKACLETLLILFIRGEGDDDLTRSWISQQSRVQNGKYPSPLLMKEQSNNIDQFSLWIADEVTQDDHNVEVLISLLENNDFYVRLYTLQFLEALVSTRPTKTKEALLSSPLGISSIVQVLEDPHDPIRNETVLLLMAIANDNFNIQKLIAFENTFDKLFEIIHEEGDIRGSIVVQDCLTLVSNLLKYNVSNQKLFIETNCLPKLSFLIGEPLGEEAIVWNDQRLQNIIICLEIVRLFVIPGNDSTKSYQEALFKADIFIYILQLSFSENTPNSVRSPALLTVADLINDNNEVQSNFSSIDVPYIDPSLPTQLQRFDGTVPVVNALLNWCLFLNSVHVFDIRVAAETVLEAYFNGNEEAKKDFIRDQIKGFKVAEAEEEEAETEEVNGTEEPAASVSELGNGIATTHNGVLESEVVNSGVQLKPPPSANILSALLEYDPEIKLNPYKIWFASVILIKLIYNNEDLKNIVTKITCGDEEAGEEVITAIQAISGLLVSTLSTQDQRISIGYLMLLIVWLYEDFHAVDDFLSDSSHVKSLLTYLSQSSSESTLTQGLVTILLGVAFEFSTKKSPLSRVDLHALIVKVLGKDNYGFKILQFKELPLFAEFSEDDIFDPKRDDTGLPNIFLHSTVVGLIKENYYRIKNTLNQDPSLDSNGRISYEKFEQLHETHVQLVKDYEEYQSKSEASRTEIEKSLERTSESLEEVSQKYEEAKAELEKLKTTHEALVSQHEVLTADHNRLRQEQEALQKSSSQKDRQLESSSGEITAKNEEIISLREQLNNTSKLKKAAEDGINKMSRELMQLTRSKETLEGQLKALEKDVQKRIKDHQKLEGTLKQKSEEALLLKQKLDSASGELKNMTSLKNSLEGQLSEAKASRAHDVELIEQMSEKLRHLATTCNELVSDKSELEEKLLNTQSELSATIEKLNDKVKQLTVSNEDLTRLSDKLGKEKDDLSILLDKSRAEYDAKVKQVESDHQKLQQDHQKISADLDAAKSLARKYESQMQEVTESLVSTKADLVKMKELHDAEISKSKESHAASIKELESVTEKKMGSLISEISDLKSVISTAEVEKVKLDENLKANITKIKSLQDNLDEKDDKVTELRSTVDVLSKEIDSLKTLKEALEAKIEETEAKLKNTESEKNATIKELRQTSKSLETELDDLAVEFETKEVELKKTIASLKEDNKSAHEEKKSLESSMEMISQTIEEKEKEYETLSKEVRAKTSEIAGLRKQVADLELKNSTLETSLAESSKKKSELENQIKDLEGKLSSVLSDLKKKEIATASAEAKFSEQKQKHIDAVKRLESQISELKTAIEVKALEFEKERTLLSEDSSSTTKEYSDKVSKLEEELQKLEKRSNVKITVLEKQKEKLEESLEEMENTTKLLSEQIGAKDEKISSLSQSLESAESNFKKVLAELTEVKSSLAAAMKYKSMLESEEKKNVKLTEEIEEHLSKSKALTGALKENENAKAAATAKHEQQITELESKLVKLESSSNELRTRNGKLLKELEKLKAEKENLSADLNEQLRKKEEEGKNVEQLLEEHETQIRVLENENNSLKSELLSLKSKIDVLEEEKISLKTSTDENTKNLMSQISALLEEKNHLATELTSLKKAHEEERSLEQQDKDATLEDLAAIKAENEKLRREMSDLNERTVARSELDEMMLLLGDLDEKKNTYKTIAKELGGDVSSDEEEDEEEDDDDDDDE